MHGDAGGDPLRWVRRGCEGAVRIAVLAASLCPALASLGGGIVAVLLVAVGWWVADPAARGRRRGRPPSRRTSAQPPAARDRW